MSTTVSEPVDPTPPPLDVTRITRRRSSLRALVVVIALLVAYSAWAISDGGLSLYIQRAFDGLSNGVLYGGVAIGLVLVFKATGIINFSQGAMATLGGYLAYTGWSSIGLPLGVAVVLAMVVSAIGAAVLQRGLVAPFPADNHLAITIVTLGMYLSLDAAAALIWGFNPKGFPSLFPHGASDYVSLDGARLGTDALATLGLVLVVMVVVQALLGRTKLGLAMRCVANSSESASLLGIDVRRSVLISWALAAAVGTLAACLTAPQTYVEPGFMDNVLVYSFAAATLGGLDSIPGAVLGGLLVGLATSLITEYIPALGSSFGLACAFLIIISVLQFRPTGLFGRRSAERV